MDNKILQQLFAFLVSLGFLGQDLEFKQTYMLSRTLGNKTCYVNIEVEDSCIKLIVTGGYEPYAIEISKNIEELPLDFTLYMKEYINKFDGLENYKGKRTMTILKLEDYQNEVFDLVKKELSTDSYYIGNPRYQATDEQIRNIIGYFAKHKLQYNTETGVTTLDGEWHGAYSNIADRPSEEDAVDEFIYSTAHAYILNAIQNPYFDNDRLVYKHESYKGKKTMKKRMNEDAKIIAELGDYKPWSGAVATYETIERAGMLEDLDRLIEELYPDGIGMTELNDLLWFEDEWVLEQLGLAETEDEEEYEESFKSSRKSSRKINENLQQEYNEITKGGRMPLVVIDTAENSHEIYFEPQGNKLVFGGMTNGGIKPEWEFDYDDSQSFDWNFQGMVEEIQQELWDEEGYPVDESLKSSRKSSRKINENEELDNVWDYLIDNDIATQEELELVTTINGYSVETLNDVIYARTGLRDIEQLKQEYGEYDESLRPSRRRKSVNENKNYRGLTDIEFIWHGANSDPELIYKGKSFNYYEVEDALYNMCKEDIEEGIFNGDANNDEDFERWLQENEGSVYSMLDDWMSYSESLRPSRRRKSVNESQSNYEVADDLRYGITSGELSDGRYWECFVEVVGLEGDDASLHYLCKALRDEALNNIADVVEEGNLKDFLELEVKESDLDRGDKLSVQDTARKYPQLVETDDGHYYFTIRFEVTIEEDLELRNEYEESLRPSRRRKSVNEISDELADKVTIERNGRYGKFLRGREANSDIDLETFLKNQDIAGDKLSRNLRLNRQRKARRAQQESLSSCRRRPVSEISDELANKSYWKRVDAENKAQKEIGKAHINLGQNIVKGTASTGDYKGIKRAEKNYNKALSKRLKNAGLQMRRGTKLDPKYAQQESLSSSLIKSAHSVLSMNEGAGDEMNTWSFKAKGFSKMLENKQPTFGTNELRCTISENLDGKLEGVVVTNYAMTKSQVEEALKEALRQNGFKSTSITELTVLY